MAEPHEVVPSMLQATDTIAPDLQVRTASRGRPRVAIWGLEIRVFHILLILFVTLAAISGFLAPPNMINWHLLGGTVALVLVAARTVWGFTGPTHARFSDFLRGPGSVIGHIRDRMAGKGERHLGHNPAGGLMVLALLAAVALLAATGVVVLGGTLKSGPLAFATSFATGNLVR